MLEKPQPPTNTSPTNSNDSLDSLRKEIKQLQKEVHFLKGLLTDLQKKFSFLKK